MKKLLRFLQRLFHHECPRCGIYPPPGSKPPDCEPSE